MVRPSAQKATNMVPWRWPFFGVNSGCDGNLSDNSQKIPSLQIRVEILKRTVSRTTDALEMEKEVQQMVRYDPFQVVVRRKPSRAGNSDTRTPRI